ncbi:hypothetical protein DGI_2526 [Megalodesulfovibrio gigas DSM 1382 = ATCC 19364]|uniref:Lipoprotein n=1 Tax=Megalodesulfovibrio gigas (strain ATCC 19364 / DSM 1382 / NCIMB 9332 / VKM B-1759) TaxID=1121448 RepID=T2GDR6_MEGG1|nr:hypothetical protein DGI_2526 [Megalodesulfovibrio gigas DSM 1382 = ATCC 19364]
MLFFHWLPACVLLVACSLALSSCSAIPDSVAGSVKGTMREGKQMWKDLLEPRPELVLDPAAFGEAQERKLAALLKPVDEQVYQLTVYMDGEDKLPPESWFRRLFERFSWISGVMVLDRSGSVLFQHPMDFSKPVDTAALIALGEPTEKERQRYMAYMEQQDRPAEENATEESLEPPVWLDHKVRAMSNNSTMGPEIFLAQPLFRKNDFDGLMVVHFDPRNLLKFCPSPDELMLMTQEQVIWTSKYHDAASTMSTLPWADILATRVYGTVQAHDRNFYWLGRNLGRYSLIYATAEPGEDEPASPAQTAAVPEAAPAPEDAGATAPAPHQESAPEATVPGGAASPQ